MSRREPITVELPNENPFAAPQPHGNHRPRRVPSFSDENSANETYDPIHHSSARSGSRKDITVELPSENPFAASQPRNGRPSSRTESFSDEDSADEGHKLVNHPSPGTTSRGDGITIDLPSVNPFAKPQPRSGRNGGQARADINSEDESAEDRRRNITELPSVNRFARDDTSRTVRSGNRSTSDRDEANEDSKSDEESDGVVRLPSVNPFSRGTGQRAGRDHSGDSANNGRRPPGRREIVIELPNHDPFAPSNKDRVTSRAARSGNKSTSGRVENNSDSEQDQEGGDVIQLPSVNPFARGPARRAGRDHFDDSADESDPDRREYVVELPRHDPFAQSSRNHDGEESGEENEPRQPRGVVDLPRVNPFARGSAFSS